MGGEALLFKGEHSVLVTKQVISIVITKVIVNNFVQYKYTNFLSRTWLTILKWFIIQSLRMVNSRSLFQMWIFKGQLSIDPSQINNSRNRAIPLGPVCYAAPIWAWLQYKTRNRNLRYGLLLEIIAVMPCILPIGIFECASATSGVQLAANSIPRERRTPFAGLFCSPIYELQHAPALTALVVLICANLPDTCINNF